jgi:hypothetical protein
LQLALVLMR